MCLLHLASLTLVSCVIVILFRPSSDFLALDGGLFFVICWDGTGFLELTCPYVLLFVATLGRAVSTSGLLIHCIEVFPPRLLDLMLSIFVLQPFSRLASVTGLSIDFSCTTTCFRLVPVTGLCTVFLWCFASNAGPTTPPGDETQRLFVAWCGFGL